MKIRILKFIAYISCFIFLSGLNIKGNDTPHLPAPSGQFGIGRTLFHWIDKSRPEVLTEAKDDHRELLVYLFYPTAKNAPGTPAAYFPYLKEIEAFEERFGKDSFKQYYGDSYAALSKMRTNTIENAQIFKGGSRHPVIIFSPGGGMPVLLYSIIIEEMVSHGYIVAAVTHSYDGSTTVLPDGRIITQNYPSDYSRLTLNERNNFLFARQKVGAEDNSFVLSQLEKLNEGRLAGAPKQFKNRIDTSLSGALGHSLGGKTSISTCQQDKRFKFCLNLDGGLGEGLSYGLTNQLVVGMYSGRRIIKKQDERSETFEKRKVSNAKFMNQIKSEYAGASPGSHLIMIDAPGFSHFSYWDLSTSDETGFWYASPEQRTHNTEMILAFTLAAFDVHLLSKNPVIYENHLKKYPEVWMEPLLKNS